MHESSIQVELLWETPADWALVALEDFDHFLVDHAACERKASALGMSFVVRYPDRRKMLDPMIHFAREELEHFHQVYRLISYRGLKLIEDKEDAYVNGILQVMRNGREERFLDRLLTSSLIEARGAERIELVAKELEDQSLCDFYYRLARAEKMHGSLFIDMAKYYFSSDDIKVRLSELSVKEAEVIASLPYRSALH